MAPTRQPKDIEVRAFKFACAIVVLCDRLEARRFAIRVLARQLLRSGTSVGANLEEAAAGLTRRDFIAKCSIALKEARETRYWLLLIAASLSPKPIDLDALIDEAQQLVAILTAIVRNARTNLNKD